MTKGTIYERWTDLLHETPEAEPALRGYFEREQERELERERLETLRERSRQAALRHLRSTTKEERVAHARRIEARTRALRAQLGEDPSGEVGE